MPPLTLVFAFCLSLRIAPGGLAETLSEPHVLGHPGVRRVASPSPQTPSATASPTTSAHRFRQHSLALPPIQNPFSQAGPLRQPSPPTSLRPVPFP